MSPTSPLDRRRELQQLAAQIRHHEQAYREGSPEIPDAAFDDLVERYSELADELGLDLGARLDAEVGSDHTEGFTTVEHRVAMLSLEKLSPNRRDSSGNPMPLSDQLAAWYRRRCRELDVESMDVIVEPKIDGISVSLLYERGRLTRAVTRGDGRKGDDITAQVRQTRALPPELAGVGGTLEIRGELYWPTAAFVRYNEELARADERTLVNPRNGCAGLMKRKDPSGLEHAGIQAFLYQVPWCEGVELPTTQVGVLQWLHEHGSPVYLDETHRTNSHADALDYCERYHERRAALGYDIDGMVVKIDDLTVYDRLAGTGHHPHWGIAYKFPPERKPTLLREIGVQVGKSGKLTPVAHLEPVFVAGTVVSRASLHNFVELERKDIRVGDTVYIEKAGEIIPQVVAVDPSKRPLDAQPMRRPSVCPTCQTPVVAEEIFIYCPNPACPDQIRERLQHFAGRSAMDVEGMGPALIDQLVERLGIRSPDALFDLSAEQLAGLDRMGSRSAENVMRSLQDAKKRGLARVLVGLAIRHVGQSMADDLAAYFGKADNLLAFAARYCSGDPQALERVAPQKSGKRGVIDGLAKKTADVIFAELDSSAVRNVFERLARAGVSLDVIRAATLQVEGVAGKSFVLTGTLPTLKRTEAAERIKAAGGRVSGSVSKNTDYVVAGTEAGSKLDKAHKLGVAVIDEAALLAMLGTHQNPTRSSMGAGD